MYLVEGDNGQLGIDVYNYLFENELTEELYFIGESYSIFDGRIIQVVYRFNDYLVFEPQNNLGVANLYLYPNGTVILNLYG